MSDDKYPIIQIRVSVFEFKKFKELKDKHGLSARTILENSICPCNHCKGVDIIIFDKETGEPIKIPRGILSKRNK